MNPQCVYLFSTSDKKTSTLRVGGLENGQSYYKAYLALLDTLEMEAFRYTVSGTGADSKMLVQNSPSTGILTGQTCEFTFTEFKRKSFYGKIY